MNKLIREKILKFRDDRNWKQFHKPKDLAISISLEAAELLEKFQWKTDEEALKDMEGIKDELADIIIYSILFADTLNIDLDEILDKKIEKNNIKYPIEKAFGKKDKYNNL